MKKHIPLRMCMVCREMKPKSELIRFINAGGKIVVDEHMKQQTRGAYMCKSHACAKNLRKKHCLERFFKGESLEAYEQIEKMFAQESLSTWKKYLE